MAAFNLDEGKKFIDNNATFSGQDGGFYRLSLVAFDKYEKDGFTPSASARPSFDTAKRAYVEDPVKRYLILDDPEIEKFVTHNKLVKKEVKPYFATVVCSWNLQKNGKLSSDVEDNYQLFYWIMPEAKLKAILNIHNMFGLHKVDLAVTCEEAKYQKMSFLPTDSSAWRTYLADPALSHVAEDVLRNGRKMFSKIRNQIGHSLSLEELRQICNMPAPGSKGASFSFTDSDADDALNSAVGASLDEEIDNLDLSGI